jgi:hypothetical protein
MKPGLKISASRRCAASKQKGAPVSAFLLPLMPYADAKFVRLVSD